MTFSSSSFLPDSRPFSRHTLNKFQHDNRWSSGKSKFFSKEIIPLAGETKSLISSNTEAKSGEQIRDNP